MGFIEIIKDAPHIAEGFIRSTLNIRTDVMIYREKEYCMKCPISHKNGNYTGICDKKRGGCGCRTEAKTSQNKIPCPLGFWANNWFKPDKFENFLKEYGST